MRVWLERPVLVKCWTFAKRRYNGHDPKTDKRVTKRPGTHAHFEGLRGECALGQYCGKPHLVQWDVNGSDGGVDMVFSPTLRAQVKANTYTPPLLRFNQEGSEVFSTEIAVLAQLPITPDKFDAEWATTNNWVDLMGWITRDDFYAKATKRDFGYGERLVVSVDQLNKMEELYELQR